MEVSQKRQVAYKIKIRDILDSQYFQEEGWKPNYLLTKDNQKISRVNILAIVISKTLDAQKNILIDDGSGKITLRIFEPLKNEPEIGDPILVIGRPREFNQEKFIVPETVKKIKNPRWIEVRKKELNFIPSQPTTPKEDAPPIQDSSDLPLENLFSLIKKLDQGSGADIEEILKQSNLDQTEELIEQLLKEGEIFEIQPGRIKILK
ncbi:hypothetical protein ACFLZB_04365 [Nanoarchaeota archaeon]